MGIVTLSDSCYQGLNEDMSGKVMKELIGVEFNVVKQTILPDNEQLLKELLIKWCEECDLILTTGGTGLGIRDVTPEATLSVADKLVPGISEGMRRVSLEKTPYGMLSRGVTVIRSQTLIINLPGSPKAVSENLEYLLPVLPHALDLVTDRKSGH